MNRLIPFVNSKGVTIPNVLVEAPSRSYDPNVDPDMEDPDGDWIRVEYPEFTFWRVDRGIKEDDWSINDPFPERTRCPRCHSTDINIAYPYITCMTCKYNEPLIDFPENVGKVERGPISNS